VLLLLIEDSELVEVLLRLLVLLELLRLDVDEVLRLLVLDELGELVLLLDRLLVLDSSSIAMIDKPPLGNVRFTGLVLKLSTEGLPVTPPTVFVSTAWHSLPSGRSTSMLSSVPAGVSFASSWRGWTPTS
jgi:hypothetical protein